MLGSSAIGMAIGFAVEVTVRDASHHVAQVRLQARETSGFWQTGGNRWFGYGARRRSRSAGGLLGSPRPDHPIRVLEPDHAIADLQVAALDHLARLRVEDVPPRGRHLSVHKRD